MKTAALFVPGRPMLLNSERSQHWRVHRATTAQTRNDACVMWRREARKGQMVRVKVDVYPTYAKGTLPDTAACLPTVKAIIDGAVDAELLAEDGPDIVTCVIFHRPVIDKDRGDGVMVVLEEIEEDSPWAT